MRGVYLGFVWTDPDTGFPFSSENTLKIFPTETELRVQNLDDMRKVISEREFNPNNESHKDFMVRFLKQTALSNGNLSKIDSSDQGLSYFDFQDKKAVEKALNFMATLEKENNILQAGKEERIEFLNSVLNKYGGITNQESLQAHLEDLYEGIKFNSMDINSAIGTLKKGIHFNKYGEFKLDMDFVRFLKYIRKYKNAIQDANSTDKDYKKDGKKLVKQLKKDRKGKFNDQYLFISDWRDSEIRDLYEFFKQELGADNFIAITDGKYEEVKDLDSVYRKWRVVDVKVSEKNVDFKVGDIDSYLRYIADFGGVDQGELADGVLRGANSKYYGGLFSRIFTNGKWAQKKDISEVSFYNELVEEGFINEDKLKNQIAEFVFGSKKDGRGNVDTIFNSGNQEQIKNLLDKFRDIALGRVAQTQNREAISADNKIFDAETLRLANYTLSSNAELKYTCFERFKSRPEYIQEINNIINNFGVDKTKAEQLLDDWTLTYLNPIMYFGIKEVVQTDVKIDKVLDYLGKELSKTTTKYTRIGAEPYLVLGMNLVSFKQRMLESGAFTWEGGASINSVTGLNGVALPLGVSGKVGLTVNDRNYIKAGQLRGNWKVSLGGSVGYDLIKNGKIFKMVGLDLNFNDVIDAVEKTIHKSNTLLRNLLDNKGLFDTESGIANTRKALNEARNEITSDKKLSEKEIVQESLYLDVLEANLIQLERVMKNPEISLNGNENIEQEGKKLALQQQVLNLWIDAVKTEYELNLKDANSKVYLAGIHIGYIFGANILNLGLNFQNIEGAYAFGRNSRLKGYFHQRDAEFDKSKEREIVMKKVEEQENGNLIVDSDVEVNVGGKYRVEIERGKKTFILLNEEGQETGNSIDVLTMINGKQIVIGNGKELKFSPSYTENNLTHNMYGINVYIPEGTEKELIETVKYTPKNIDELRNAVKNDIFRGRNFDTTRFENLLCKAARGSSSPGYNEYFNRLLPAIANYSRNPSQRDTLNTVILDGPSSFQHQHKYLASLNNEKMLLLTSYIIQLSFGDNIVKRAIKDGKLELSGKSELRKHLLDVVRAEREVLGGKFDKIMDVKEQLIKAGEQPLEKGTFIESGNLENYSKIITAGVSTPKLKKDAQMRKGGELVDMPKQHRLMFTDGLNPTIYGPQNEISDKDTQLAIIEQFEPRIKEQYDKMITYLGKISPQIAKQITLDYYIEMIKDPNQECEFKGNETGNTYTFRLSASKFSSFNIAIPRKECLNIGFGLAIGQPSLDVSGGDFALYSETGRPTSQMKQYTIAIGFNTNEHETIKETVTMLDEQKTTTEETKIPNQTTETGKKGGGTSTPGVSDETPSKIENTGLYVLPTVESKTREPL